MSEEAGEKSFAPTAKRRQDAAKKGDVLRSKELGTAVGVLTGALWLKYFGPWLMDSLKEIARTGFSFRRSDIADFDPGRVMSDAVLGVAVPIVTLGLVVMAATVASQLLFGDGRFMVGNLAPKASRMDPVKGLGRIFGINGLIELGKSILKLGLLGGLAWWWGSGKLDDILGLGRGDLTGQLSAAWHALTTMLMILAAGLGLIAAVDFPIQWFRQMGRLKMTLQQVRDEGKESEGSPEKRNAIRQRQRQIASGGVTKAMGEAQFLLTNPTHFSVAMKYDPAIASAPIVIAKGRGEKALAMRELAAQLKVPTLEFPALARSVYFTTRENQMIRAELYSAIASVLAFVLSLKRGEQPDRPRIDLPATMQFDSEGRARA
ncbi:EscU/YscU/HrcU family type III secretion system export apparatus switch protein [Allopontixanthobacter sediminis]|uniref:Flagellar type III secretion system protein FlhB n=1 Tax=Allopontixanthobacter sediminis TaxID=1689985 RepID=A0A845B615_9SPHN|nr:flagellar type III secretion system protein FlhB [Allopontixanthobacter sediminis]MXP44942.1 flagellar type III secretion system protein FlhB [Allopontixanthobacter sediminis]